MKLNKNLYNHIFYQYWNMLRGSMNQQNLANIDYELRMKIEQPLHRDIYRIMDTIQYKPKWHI